MLEVTYGWRLMKDAPTDGKTQIVARHEPNKHTPHGWVATILRGDGDYEESPHPFDQILHYNGDVLVIRFHVHGMWTGWMYPEEFAGLSDALATAVARARREALEEAAEIIDAERAKWGWLGNQGLDKAQDALDRLRALAATPPEARQTETGDAR